MDNIMNDEVGIISLAPILSHTCAPVILPIAASVWKSITWTALNCDVGGGTVRSVFTTATTTDMEPSLSVFLYTHS